MADLIPPVAEKAACADIVALHGADSSRRRDARPDQSVLPGTVRNGANGATGACIR